MTDFASTVFSNHASARRPGLLRYLSLRRQRHNLAKLDDHILRDIGLTREQADAESRRPIWDAPAHWK